MPGSNERRTQLARAATTHHHRATPVTDHRPPTTDHRPPISNPSTSVGRNVPRKDGLGKATGLARYIDDLSFPDMLYGRTIRSTIARGRIRDVRLGFDPAGFTIVTSRAIPAGGRNVVALIEEDQPFLADGEIRHVAEPILLLAHADREALRAATVEIEYEEEEPVLDPEASTVVLKELSIDKGDLAAGFAAADRIIDGEYRTGHQEHIYIETNGVIAVPEHDGVTVYGSLQCPFYVAKALRMLLGPDRHVRVVQTETGGGFGGKEEYPSMIAGHAALLALQAKRPVKLVYDRLEDMLATTKRHPSIVRHRTGVAADGRITAMDVEIILDGGAYVTLSPVVLSRGAIHAAGPYRCDHTRIRGRAMQTHTPPNGAFRGFGAPQTQFAMEVHMERIAEALGMDPVELRRLNALRPGDTTATGQRLGDDTSAVQVLDEAVRRSDFHRKREAYRGTGRGIGLALYWHGSGFTGGGEVKLASQAALELTPTGVRILVASVEMGQGTRTMLAQIVADELGVPYEDIQVAQPDTGIVPDSGPTVASRTCMIVGGILQRCADEMRRTLGGRSPADYFREHGPLRITKQHLQPDWIRWDEDRYVGDAYATYAWACDVAEIEIDPVTAEVRPLRMTVVADVGRAIHPKLAVGQIEGGTAQGVGWAILEEVVMRGGAMANAQLTNYLIPTTLDTPAIDVLLLENPYHGGPHGAKGLGELPIDGPAPAIVNAVRQTGADVRRIPVTAELMAQHAAPA